MTCTGAQPVRGAVALQALPRNTARISLVAAIPSSESVRKRTALRKSSGVTFSVRGDKLSTGKTYTVKAGDTLSKIAKEQLGDAKAYQNIFNANRDQLTDPDEIKPGQVLKIPSMAQ